MRTYIIIASLVVILGIAGLAWSQYQHAAPPADTTITVAAAQPQIVILDPSHDFGRVRYGDVSHHTFTISNTGAAPLVIEGVSTSCGCTSAEVSTTDIPAGGSADLIVSFDPAVHKDDTDLGPLTRTIYVDTNDPEQPEVEAKIYADVYK